MLQCKDSKFPPKTPPLPEIKASPHPVAIILYKFEYYRNTKWNRNGVVSEVGEGWCDKGNCVEWVVGKGFLSAEGEKRESNAGHSPWFFLG